MEAEVAQLPPEEEQSFLEALGVEESGRYRLIRTVFNLLGLISFFTVGEDEVKAWTIHQGDNAVTAAGKIHSDLARGFIRAEVIPYDGLIAAGDEKAARAGGSYRLEQKNYVVKDGDVMNIRFSSLRFSGSVSVPTLTPDFNRNPNRRPSAFDHDYDPK